MPFRKLSEPESPWAAPEDYCKHSEHEPPTMIVLGPGTYEWSCPACGAVRTVRVARPSWVGLCYTTPPVEREYTGDCLASCYFEALDGRLPDHARHWRGQALRLAHEGELPPGAGRAVEALEEGRVTSPYRERAVDRIADIRALVGEDDTFYVTVKRQEVLALLRIAEAALSVGTAPGSELDLAIGELGASRR